MLAAKLDAWPHANADGATYDARVATSPTADTPASLAARERIAAQLAEADVLVVLISEDARTNEWLRWEIATARAAARRIGLVGVLLQPWHLRPAELRDCGAIFVPFKRDMVERAVRWAATEQHGDEDYELVDE